MKTGPDISSLSEFGPGLAPKSWFGVPVWLHREPKADQLNPALKVAIASVKAEEAGLQRSNDGGWHSKTTLHTDPRFAAAVDLIGTLADQAARSIHFNFATHRLGLKELWANVNGPGDSNRSHIHPDAHFSGVYYVTAPEGSGALVLSDPIRERTMAALPVEKRTSVTSGDATIPPKAGLAILFPAWLPHHVERHKGTGERTSLSFNILAVPKARP